MCAFSLTHFSKYRPLKQRMNIAPPTGTLLTQAFYCETFLFWFNFIFTDFVGILRFMRRVRRGCSQRSWRRSTSSTLRSGITSLNLVITPFTHFTPQLIYSSEHTLMGRLISLQLKISSATWCRRTPAWDTRLNKLSDTRGECQTSDLNQGRI